MGDQDSIVAGEHLATQLAVEGTVNAAGEFEVLAITAGEGNGWAFGAAVLKESLPLWEGAECFVDHTWGMRSIRNLAGVLHDCVWDEERQGVKGRLRPVGPSAPLLSELGKQLLAEGKKNPRVGFSADVVFTAVSRDVKKILRVNAVDLVFNPARGGAFLRALNSTGYEVKSMDGEEERQDQQQQSGGATRAQLREDAQAVRRLLNEDVQAVKTLLDVQQEQAALAAQAEEARKVRAQMCGYLLDSGLAAAKLPGPVTERIRKQFSGRVFEPGELTQAIDDARQMVSELTGGLVAQGPARISGMFSSEDQFGAAVYDLLGAERPEGLQGLKTARLSGIRELYVHMTGDVDFAGGYDSQRVQFATSANLPGVLKNAMNKLIVQEWQQLGRSGYRWWEPVVSVEHFNSLQPVTGVLVGEVTVLPAIDEGDPYTELAVSDSEEAGEWVKYGGYVGLTLEMFERDETHRLRLYPRKLASAGLRRISALVAGVFTAEQGVGPEMADKKAVFHEDHGNLGTTALSSESWEEASAAIYDQAMIVGTDGTAPKLALDAKYLLVPRALRLTGMGILYPSFAREANIFSENMQKGQMGDVITVPEFSDDEDWAAVADPNLAPGIVIAERFGLLPEIIMADSEKTGALFTNDEIRMKARHWLSVFVADYRPLYKANVVTTP